MFFIPNFIFFVGVSRWPCGCFEGQTRREDATKDEPNAVVIVVIVETRCHLLWLLKRCEATCCGVHEGNAAWCVVCEVGIQYAMVIVGLGCSCSCDFGDLIPHSARIVKMRCQTL